MCGVDAVGAINPNAHALQVGFDTVPRSGDLWDNSDISNFGTCGGFPLNHGRGFTAKQTLEGIGTVWSSTAGFSEGRGSFVNGNPSPKR